MPLFHLIKLPMVTVKEELEMMVVLNITENREKESREIDRRSSCSKQAILPTSHNSASMVGSSPMLAVSQIWADWVCIMTTLPHNPYW